jgi:hypothetical protein
MPRWIRWRCASWRVSSSRNGGPSRRPGAALEGGRLPCSGSVPRGTFPRADGQVSPSERAEIAQLVEHATENRGVASSILALGTTYGWCGYRAEVAQLVEHHLAKVRVAGSSPVFRSISFLAADPDGVPPRFDPLPLRLVVGQRTLDPLGEVRILEGQPVLRGARPA